MSNKTVYIISLGCAKNLVDSEVMLGNLLQKGFAVANEIQEAKLIVINTCGFLRTAVDEAIDKILEAAECKESGACKKLIVIGCMVERYREKLQVEFPEVDAFLSVDELLKVDFDAKTSIENLGKNQPPTFLYNEKMPRTLSNGGYSTNLKIADGCNRPCAFCIIPKLRGNYRSRTLDSVVEEFKNLLAQGVNEINLVAQDTTNYGVDLNPKITIHNLLDKVAKLSPERDFWIRLMYAYPLGIDEALIKQIAETPKICNYLDLPLQHISGKILTAMYRPLGEKKTRTLVENIRKWSPNISFRTTFITGFPGEAEEDVAQLEAFILEGHFDHIGVFAYSAEEEARAFPLGDPISQKEKNARVKHLMLAQKKMVRQKLKTLIGSKQKVLVEGFHPDTNMLLIGRTEAQAPEVDGITIINEIVGENGDKNIDISKYYGKFFNAEITEVKGYDLVATI